MKPHFTFFFIFLFLLGFGQDNGRRRRECEELRRKYEEVCKNVKNEKKNINYNTLAKKIIEDVDKEKIKSENLVFFYDVEYVRYGLLSDDDNVIWECKIDEKLYHHNFNQETFWTKNNIKFLGKYLNKNIILSNQNLVFTKPNQNEKKSFKKKNKHYVSLRKFFQKQKQGDYTLVTSVKKEETKMFYLPYDSNENLHLIYNKTNNSRNFNTLKLEFFNYPNKIVKIGFLYNFDYEKKIYKTYQYQNKKWVEIPTTDEYKF